MAIFGARKQNRFGQIPGMAQEMPQPQFGAPGRGMAEPMGEPARQKPNLLGVIGDSLQILGGGQATYVPQMQQQQQYEMQQRQRQIDAQQQRKTGWQDYVRKQEYERANPATPQPTEFERILQASGLKPEEQTRLRQDYARNRANPVQGVPYTDEQGNSGLQFIRPGQMQVAPPAPVGKLRPIGGQPGGISPFVQ